MELLWIRWICAPAALVAALVALPATGTEPPPSRPIPPGPVCGDPELVGRPLPAIREAGGCGVDAAISLWFAKGVALEPPATLACDTARTLVDWLGQVAPVFAQQGADLAALTVVDAYSCRNRNRLKEGRLSEHALGRAIDIAGFRLADGTVVTVRDGWSAPEWWLTLRRAHRAGCGTFGTVLGPEANPQHADHLHLDLERRRSGSYCR
jgi:hypothetical protein